LHIKNIIINLFFGAKRQKINCLFCERSEQKRKMFGCIIYNDVIPSTGAPNPAGLWKGLNFGYANADLREFRNTISYIKMHPMALVGVSTDLNYRGTTYTFDGKNGDVTWAMLKAYGLNDNIDGIVVYSTGDVNAWEIQQCRAGAAASDFFNPTNCNFNCNLNNFTSDEYCRSTWCGKFPSECDSLKVQYCQMYPQLAICECITGHGNEAILAAKYPKIPTSCLAGSKCQGSDFIDSLITNTIKKKVCPSLIEQNAIINATNSVLTNVSINQTANTTTNTAAPPPASKRNFYLFLIFFIIFIIIIVAAAAVLYYEPF
jgi:hypothetical protein